MGSLVNQDLLSLRVPQGSVLDLLLFLRVLYASDMLIGLENKTV